ncbi:MAG: hypothetical protein MJ201_01375 [Mycoplasmoidaceae bacterium]|nr:hypothetical protein [Mycoplasmoidaceae bacterium]
MIKTTPILVNEISNFAQPNHKLQRMVRDGKIFPLKRGLYETDVNANPMRLANIIVSPSYISFATALSYYDLIPERVVSITSASFNLRKSKSFKNRFGHYVYQDIPKSAFWLGVKTIDHGDGPFHIATLEKAICDELYLLPPMDDIKQLEYMLFTDLRFNEEVFNTIKKPVIAKLAKLYRCKNIYLLNEYLKEVR